MSTSIHGESSDQVQAPPSSEAGTGLPKTLRQAVLLVSLPPGMLGFILPVYGREIGAKPVQIGLFFSDYANGVVLLVSVLVLWALLRVPPAALGGEQR